MRWDWIGLDERGSDWIGLNEIGWKVERGGGVKE